MWMRIQQSASWQNRHGETSTVLLGWDGATRFMDVDFKR